MLSVIDVHHAYGDKRVLQGITLEAVDGEIVCLLGGSGSGKSTLLRLIAGLERPNSGDIRWDGASILNIPAHERNFGLMFQDYALFPHMNVQENVEFGLRMMGARPAIRRQRAQETLALVGLTGYERRNVTQLSGGERQRVALARSLAREPRLLMLDEPLGALDAVLRDRLIVELRDIMKAARLTAIYVTHDRREAFAVADRLAILETGVITQFDTPAAVYRRPATVFAARLLGLGNVIPVTEWRDGTAITPLGAFALEQAAPALLLHPDGLDLGDQFGGVVTEAVFQGDAVHISVNAHDLPLAFKLDARRASPQPGDSIRLAVQPDYIIPLR